MRARVLVIGAVLVTSGCEGASAGWAGTITDSAGVAIVVNPASATWGDRPEPRVTEELRIGTIVGEPEYQFGMVAGVDVDAAGRIYVLDQQAARVRVFDAEGRFVRSIGRPGNGPGELSVATMAVLVGTDETVYVLDAGLQRISAFTSGDAFSSAAVDIMSGIPMLIAPSEDGRMIMQLRAMAIPGITAPGAAGVTGDFIVACDPATERADTLLALESGNSMQFGAGGALRMRLFDSEPMWAIAPDGRIVHGRNDVFRVEVLGPDGSLERIITQPMERRPLTEADQAAFRRFLRETMESALQAQGVGQQAAAVVDQMINGMEFADNYPAFAMLRAGPHGTLWVQRIRTADDVAADGGQFQAQDVGSAIWDVLDAEGRLLGPIRMPDRFQPLRIRDEFVYGVQRDELDVQYVVRLRVDGLAAAE